MDDYAMRLQSQGIGMDQYMSMMGMNADMMRASARPAALKQVQTEAVHSVLYTHAPGAAQTAPGRYAALLLSGLLGLLLGPGALGLLLLCYRRHGNLRHDAVYQVRRVHHLHRHGRLYGRFPAVLT